MLLLLELNNNTHSIDPLAKHNRFHKFRSQLEQYGCLYCERRQQSEAIWKYLSLLVATSLESRAFGSEQSASMIVQGNERFKTVSLLAREKEYPACMSAEQVGVSQQIQQWDYILKGCTS